MEDKNQKNNQNIGDQPISVISKTPKILNHTQEKVAKNKNRLVWATVVLFAIVLTIIWFIFGWLYGPRPNLNTLPKTFSSYFQKNQSNSITENTQLVSVEGDLSFLKSPKGFEVTTFAENLGGPNPYVPGLNWGVRQMISKNDVVYATIHKEGKVMALVDKDGDGKVDEQKVFLENLSLPHGIDIYQDWIYVAQNNQIIRVKDADSDGVADEAPEKVIDLPPFLEHWTRTVRIFHDPNDLNTSMEPKMYVSIGSSCNSCIESNSFRAAIIECTVDGKDCKVYAKGFRNAVDFSTYQGKIYATETGKDFLGNDIPPEEINIIKRDKDYGWPRCYGKKVWDTSFDSTTNTCAETEPSWVDLPAHSTAIGVTGYTGNKFPEPYKNSLYVALHGSYQSIPAVGYKVVKINTNTGEATDFLTGFNQDNKTQGRPVHILNYKDGLLISDDQYGKIYFVSYKG